MDKNIEKIYWLISAPKTREDTFNTLNKKTTDDNDLSINYKFQIPDLKVGTLDSLMALSDELSKYDIYIENVTKKIANQLFDLIEKETTNFNENLTVNNTTIDTYLSFFRWDEAKYPTSHSLKALTELIHTHVSKLEEELKIKSTEYNNILHSLQVIERKQGGNLLTKDLTDFVKEEHVIESEYLDTIFVTVPKYLIKQWNTSYEKLTDFVMPRSCLLITEDNEYALFRIVLFKRVVEDFKNIAREKKFFVRDFKFDKNRSSIEEKKKMETEKDKLKRNLIRWCKTNFGETFSAWIHLKAIRIFVESVLRYGLPTNFQAMLLLPRKNKQKALRKILHDLYSHLSSKTVYTSINEEDEEHEKFFPYVFLEINIDFKNKNQI
jgi:V-type H+-transporting ATPase subunit C